MSVISNQILSYYKFAIDVCFHYLLIGSRILNCKKDWDGGYTYSSGGGDEVVVGTCQARKARKELLVVFVQEVKCEMQPYLNKYSQS